MVEILYSVQDNIASCGISDEVTFDGMSNAERIAQDVFDDQFMACMDITDSELDATFKEYSRLTAEEGRIRLTMT